MDNISIYAILASKPHNEHYLTRYFKFILSCKHSPEDYTEKHHICPKAKDLFPEYSKLKTHPWNMAVLTARQHFIANWMLWKAYPKIASQFYAFDAFVNIADKNSLHKRSVKINSTSYSILKAFRSEQMKGDRNYFAKNKFVGEKNHFYGKSHTTESKNAISKSNSRPWEESRGKDASDKCKRKFSEERTGEGNTFYGKTHSQDSIDKIKAAAINRPEDYYIKIAASLAKRPKLKCPHCDVLMDERNVKRYHFSKCKNLKL
jgi:hypothetical protein